MRGRLSASEDRQRRPRSSSFFTLPLLALIDRDPLGRVIAAQEAVAPDGGGRYQVDMEAIAPGPYILELQLGAARWSTRFLKG